MIEKITSKDFWYKKLYEQCFNKPDVWMQNIGEKNYYAYHIERKAFIIIQSISIDEAEIISIGVHPDFRRSGFALKLLTFILKDFYKVFLEVNETNYSAINLYEKIGFKPISIRKGYFGKCSAIVMGYYNPQ